MAGETMGYSPSARIKVIGVGGGGTNAVTTMIKAGIEGVDFVSANTDIQSLQFSLAENKIQLGKELTKGLGAGANPDIGRDAALEDRHELQEQLANSDMVFITAGMGGGTGTGGAAVVSQIAREQGALTVGVVTRPFSFEGKRRQRHAQAGIDRLREHVDTLIVIPNDRLLGISTPDLSMVNAFRMADNVLVNAVRGISDIINIPGMINVDFADVKSIMLSMGQALMGVGEASGPGRAKEAADAAISSPLLEDIDIEGATGILINITSGSDLGLMEVNEACTTIQAAAHEDANIIFGAVVDESFGDAIRVTVIATGFPVEDELSQSQPRAVPVARTVDPFHSKKPGALAVKEETPKPVEIQPTPTADHHITTTTLDHTSTAPLSEQSSTLTTPQEIEDSSILEAPTRSDIENLAMLTLDQADAMSETEIPADAPPVTHHIQGGVKAEDQPQPVLIEDIDKKIDAALEMADKLQSSAQTEDELEIPTFLRQQKPEPRL